MLLFMMLTKTVPSMARQGAATLSMVVLVIFFGATPIAKAAPTSEYELKAVFLLNFARFNGWPKETLPPGTEPLIIGVLGADPFGSALNAAVQGEQVSGHPLEVRRFGRQDDFSQCHMLFISKSEEAYLPAILSFLRGKPILTVSDIDRFVYQKGMIGMQMEQGRVRIQVNFDRTKGEGLEISAKLLRVSLVIRDGQHSMLPYRSRFLCFNWTYGHAEYFLQ